jgi:glycosyltransferase involved in cell wall biosynthesis
MSNKKVLIYTTYFYPENFKVNDIAFNLIKEGADVTVITAIPNYPKGVYFEGYGIFKKRKETINGVNVIRLPIIPRGSGSALRLILNYLSYALISFFHAFYIGFTRKFDCIFVHHVSPVFIGIPAIVVKKIQGIKLYFWNLDLWPEILVANTNIRSSFFFKTVLVLVKWIYKNVDIMLIGSQGYRKSMLERNLTEDKIIYFPNWAEEVFFEPIECELPFEMPTGFNIVYAGNIGESQDFENVIKAIEILKNENINWIFVGDGRKRIWFENIIQEKALGKVLLPGSLSINYMPNLYKKADLLLVSLVDEPIFTLPQKVQTYMTSGTPIVGMLNGEGNELIRHLNCGRSCNAGDYRSLSQNVLELSKMTAKDLSVMGNNALVYCKDNFHPKKSLQKLSSILNITNSN